MSNIFQLIRRALGFLRYHWKSTTAVILLLLVGSGIYAATRPSQPEYITETARRGELIQTVEAVGTVVSERDLQLQFPVVDVVSKVYVREGDRVIAGQQLAALRAGSLAAAVAGASANVQSAQAQLRAIEEGSRPEDIAVIEAQVANKRAALEAARQSFNSAEQNLKTSQQKLATLKSEASISLSGDVANAGNTVSRQLSAAKTALSAVRGVMDSNDVQDSMIKTDPGKYNLIRSRFDTADQVLSQASSATAAGSFDYQEALMNLDIARFAVSQTSDTVRYSYDTLLSLTITSFLSQSNLEAHKTSVALHLTAVQTALTGLDTAIKTLRDSSATYDTRIATEESAIAALQGTRDRAKADISTYETSLMIDEAQLNLKKAPARQTDIDAARARVRQAQAELSRASAQYGDTILRAPVEGFITKVNVKTGEMRPSAEPSVTMLGSAPYRIEMYVSEIDVPKIRATQSGSIELDAFNGTYYQLNVSEIDSAPTLREGVSKYRVRLDFVYPHDELRIGMTGDATIITGRRADVVSVPSRAVIGDGDGRKIVRVLSRDGRTFESREVQTGMEGESGNIEVSGVNEGEIVIVLIRD